MKKVWDQDTGDMDSSSGNLLSNLKKANQYF